MFSPWLAKLFAKAFTPPPDVPVNEWAEKEVYLEKKHAPEEGFYRSSKTPWTRWLQDMIRNPWRVRNGRRIRIRKVRIRKCTQSGFTEAILNGIRFCAKFTPRNVVYAINSKEEAINIRERLVDTLKRLGQEIFVDDDADALARYTLRLAQMNVWFLGSFSAGAFSNKHAPLVVGDELDDHAHLSGNSDTLSLLDERCKAGDGDDDLSIALSKPKMKGGPIDKACEAGDLFAWMVPCPHCGTYQRLTWESVRFAHCKDLTGHWDKERLLFETWYRCTSFEACRIEEKHKAWMEARGRWWQISEGDPETVSLEMSDLHSMHGGSTWGHLAKEFVEACAAAAKGDFSKLQAFKNGRLGEGFEQREESVEYDQVLACRSAYRRGIIPHDGLLLACGMDVGLYVNTKWVVVALHPLTCEAWIIDYGLAGQPVDLLTIMAEKRYECPRTGRKQGIALSFIDARYHTEKVYAVSQQRPRQIWPMMGLASHVTTRSIALQQVPGRQGLGVITFKKEGAHADLYLDRIQARRPPRLHFPDDADEEFMREFCNEYMIRDPRTNKLSWSPKPRGPNHWADAVEDILTGYDFLTDGPRTRAAGESSNAPAPQSPEAPPAGDSPEIDLSLLASNGLPPPGL